MAPVVLELALLVLPLFLPGYFLVNALYPAKGSLGGEFDGLYRLFFGVVLSVALTVLYGTALVVLAPSGAVLFLPGPLWVGLGILTVALFALGVWRGAYPRLARLLGRPAAAPAAREEPDRGLFARLDRTTEELEATRRKLAGASPDERGPLQEEVRRLEEEKGRLEAQARGLW